MRDRCLVGSPEMQQAIQAQARIAIELSVQYGFENLIDFLENEYLLNVRPGMDKGFSWFPYYPKI